MSLRYCLIESACPLRILFAVSLLTALLWCCAAPCLAASVDGTLNVKLDRSRIHLGDSAAMRIVLQMPAALVLRNMSYPELAGTGFSVGEFSPPRQMEHLQNGIALTVYEFSAVITPLRTGVIRVGPVRLNGELSAPANGAGAFFGETVPQKISFEAPAQDLTVIPLPAAGRPADFTGVIGSFVMKVSAGPLSLPPGSPLTVTTRISGTGNLQKVRCPEVQAPGFRSYPAQGGHSAAGMLCSQVVIPQQSDALAIPPLQFSFFNSSTARYETLRSRAIPLNLTERNPQPSDVRSVAPERSPEKLPQKLFSRWQVALSALAVGIGVFLFKTWRWRRNIVDAVPDPPQPDREGAMLQAYLQDASRAFSGNDAELFYLSVFRALEIMRKDPAFADNALISELSYECDAVRYGRHVPQRREMEKVLERARNLRV